MRIRSDTPRSASVGLKLSLLTAVFLFTGLTALSLWLSSQAAGELRDTVGQSMARQQEQVTDMISLFDRTLASQATNLLNILLVDIPPDFILLPDNRIDVVGQSTPTLLNGGRALNGDYSMPDSFTRETGAPVTMFARDGDDFVRVTTSLKKADGSRAVGTLLERSSPSYTQLTAGTPYTGIATLFGVPYITKYKPITDGSGGVIGASFIGINITSEMAALEDRIRQMGQGESGFAMLVDVSAKNQGQVIAGGPFEGQSIADIKTAEGDRAFAPLFNQPDGVMHYVPAASDGRARTVYYHAYPAWNWMIASTVFNDEIDAGIVALRNKCLMAGLLLTLLLAAIIYLLQRRLIGRPLGELVAMARDLAQGNLSRRTTHSRRDEIGQLAQAMNGIGEGLTNIVTQVRQSTARVGKGAAAISKDGAQLSSRSEQAASSLEQTSASLEQITATVTNTADGARQASQLIDDTAGMARQGDEAMHAAQTSMQAITESSHKIGDIITLINDIAFQTNILALNASVEAARAGEHGRGFAVVAQEVRSLADRAGKAATDIRTLVDRCVQDTQTGDIQLDAAATQVKAILEAVNRVNTVIGEISTGAAEQSEGIRQINAAVSDLDSTTQQNAAMVAQSTQAANDMDRQAAELEQLMAAFTLDDATPVDTRSAEPTQPRAETAIAPRHRARDLAISNDAEWQSF